MSEPVEISGMTFKIVERPPRHYVGKPKLFSDAQIAQVLDASRDGKAVMIPYSGDPHKIETKRASMLHSLKHHRAIPGGSRVRTRISKDKRGITMWIEPADQTWPQLRSHQEGKKP